MTKICAHTPAALQLPRTKPVIEMIGRYHQRDAMILTCQQNPGVPLLLVIPSHVACARRSKRNCNLEPAHWLWQHTHRLCKHPTAIRIRC